MTELGVPIRRQLQQSSRERMQEVTRVLVASSVRKLINWSSYIQHAVSCTRTLHRVRDTRETCPKSVQIASGPAVQVRVKRFLSVAINITPPDGKALAQFSRQQPDSFKYHLEVCGLFARYTKNQEMSLTPTHVIVRTADDFADRYRLSEIVI